MPCIYPTCGAPDGPETQHWNVGTLCSAHYGTIAASYNIPGNASLVDDFVKVHLLLQYNPVRCLTLVSALNTEMNAAKGGAAPTDPRFAKSGVAANYLKLSRALEYYEGYCWFPANRALLSGLLSTPGFNQSLKLGFNKDPGAGRSHGEQSHRLQWHAIMRAATDSFQTPINVGAQWKHSPLQLFYHYTQGLGATVNAWGVAMDSQGNPGWGNPDVVVADILRSNLTLVKEALVRRIDKMGGPDKTNPVPGVPVNSARDQALQASMVSLINRRAITMPPGENPTTLFNKIVLQIYTWEKTKTPFIASTPLQKVAKNVWEHAKAAAPHHFHANHGYKAIDTNLLVKKDAPDRIVEIDTALVASSRNGFSPEYSYSNAMGASPRIPSRW